MVTLLAEHAVTIADEKALSEVYMFKGHAGTKPCALCKNLVDHRSSYAENDTTATLLPLTDLSYENWTRTTDVRVKQTLRRLGDLWRQHQLGHVSAAACAAATQIAGWNYNAHHIMLHPTLDFKFAIAVYYDWMHIWCVDGVFSRELTALLSHRPSAFTCRDLHNYLMRWVWPRGQASGARVFECGRYSGTASETLSSAPVLAKFVRDVVMPLKIPELQASLHSFLCCCKTLALLNAGRRGATSPEELFASTMAFLTAHQLAYGTEHWAWKHHAATHVPDMWKRSGVLLNCWVHERKHKLVKRFVQNRKIQQGMNAVS